jgi:hypothetical protein
MNLFANLITTYNMNHLLIELIYNTVQQNKVLCHLFLFTQDIHQNNT